LTDGHVSGNILENDGEDMKTKTNLPKQRPKPKPRNKSKTKKTKPKKRTANPDMIITQYVKKKNGERVGIMVGTLDEDGYVMLGWSRANINAGDKFDPVKALNIATQRLKAEEIVPIPHSMSDMFNFQSRCQRYFKDAKGSHKIAIQEIKQPKKESQVKA